MNGVNSYAPEPMISFFFQEIQTLICPALFYCAIYCTSSVFLILLYNFLVAKSDKRAAKSRKILKACGIWINSSNNIVRLKTSMHVRVHSNEYHGFVQESLERVYTKNDNYETNREKVKCVLYKIKRFLRALNKTCP